MITEKEKTPEEKKDRQSVSFDWTMTRILDLRK
jgi:hypothetical protein